MSWTDWPVTRSLKLDRRSRTKLSGQFLRWSRLLGSARVVLRARKYKGPTSKKTVTIEIPIDYLEKRLGLSATISLLRDSDPSSEGDFLQHLGAENHRLETLVKSKQDEIDRLAAVVEGVSKCLRQHDVG